MYGTRHVTVGIVCAGLAAFGAGALADAAAGKAAFARQCVECHNAGDFDGDDPAQLSATLKAMASGAQKHRRPITLTEQEIADVAAYMAAGGK